MLGSFLDPTLFLGWNKMKYCLSLTQISNVWAFQSDYCLLGCDSKHLWVPIIYPEVGFSKCLFWRSHSHMVTVEMTAFLADTSKCWAKSIFINIKSIATWGHRGPKSHALKKTYGAVVCVCVDIRCGNSSFRASQVWSWQPCAAWTVEGTKGSPYGQRGQESFAARALSRSVSQQRGHPTGPQLTVERSRYERIHRPRLVSGSMWFPLGGGGIENPQW